MFPLARFAAVRFFAVEGERLAAVAVVAGFAAAASGSGGSVGADVVGGAAATGAAADLYGFLTNFTAGVRRGLDASGRNGQGGA